MVNCIFCTQPGTCCPLCGKKLSEKPKMGNCIFCTQPGTCCPLCGKKLSEEPKPPNIKSDLLDALAMLGHANNILARLRMLLKDTERKIKGD